MTKKLQRIPKRIKTFFKDLITRVINDDFMGTASEMAYIFTLAIFPFLIFLVSVFGLLGTEARIDKIMDFYNHWDKRTTGLFISKNNVLCFVRAMRRTTAI